MRVPLEWLRQYCDPDLDVAAIEERLTMTGTKVEAVHTHGVSAVDRFVVGHVISVEQHPNADRLKVCEVDLGPARAAGAGGVGGVVTIVCGAPNVAAGQDVAVALPGATMPDGTKLKAAKLRGVASAGMILAEDELEIGPGHAGILVLDRLAAQGALAPDVDLSPGAPLADVLPLGTDVLELEITPNRPDCLGVYGVARELHAATGAPLAPAPWHEGAGADESAPPVAARAAGSQVGTAAEPQNGADAAAHANATAAELPGLRVRVECPDLCPRFTARVFDDVSIAPSPPWLTARLAAAGQRAINNVVDITNYAMLLSGQPLHAFDLDRVAGGQLTVRRARDGEQIVTLDEQTRTLDAQMIVIEDADGPTSLAGVMGGSRSEVQPETRTVAIEVANWHGPSIHRTSWALGLRSEASSRFEKGLAPEQCDDAMAVATQLMTELCGATPRAGAIDVCEPLPAPRTITLRSRRLAGILGVAVPRERQQQILTALDFAVSPAAGQDDALQDAAGENDALQHAAEEDGALDVRVPALRRNDVTREADLVEEVARVDGLERLPATLPARRGAYGTLSRAQQLRRRLTDALVGRGLYETVGWTFASPNVAERLRLPMHDERRALAVALENPLSEEQSLLRTSLLGSLLEAASRNQARGAGDLRLFERGTVFLDARRGVELVDDGVDDPAIVAATGVRERRALAVLLRGRLQPPTWAAPDPPRADFFAAKGLLEMLTGMLGLAVECEPEALPFLHPGRSARATALGEPIGWIGELHPDVVERFELGQPGGDGVGAALPAAFELDLDVLLALAPAESPYRDLISFPALRQDLAVTLPQDVPAATVLRAVREAAGAMLHDAHVFDVYSGPQVGEGRRSLALALGFRASDRTLSDEDVEPALRRIVAALQKLGGELRG